MHACEASGWAREGGRRRENYVRRCLSMVETWPPSPRDTRQYLLRERTGNTSQDQHVGPQEEDSSIMLYGVQRERNVDAPVDGTGSAERLEEAFIVRDDDELELQGANTRCQQACSSQLLSCVSFQLTFACWRRSLMILVLRIEDKVSDQVCARDKKRGILLLQTRRTHSTQKPEPGCCHDRGWSSVRRAP